MAEAHRHAPPHRHPRASDDLRWCAIGAMAALLRTWLYGRSGLGIAGTFRGDAAAVSHFRAAI